jgi:hypothetical protein
MEQLDRYLSLAKEKTIDHAMGVGFRSMQNL